MEKLIVINQIEAFSAMKLSPINCLTKPQ